MDFKELEKIIEDLSSDDEQDEEQPEEIKQSEPEPKPEPKKQYKKPKSVENMQKARKARTYNAIKKADTKKNQLLKKLDAPDVYELETKYKNQDEKFNDMINKMNEIIYKVSKKKKEPKAEPKAEPKNNNNEFSQDYLYQQKKLINILNL